MWQLLVAANPVPTTQPRDALLSASRDDDGLYLRDRLASLLRSRNQRARVDLMSEGFNVTLNSWFIFVLA